MQFKASAGLRFRTSEQQHERFAIRIRTKAVPLVKGFGPLIDGLHDDGAGANYAGRRQRTSRRVDHEVRSETTALAGFVHRKLSQKDDRNRVRHDPIDPR